MNCLKCGRETAEGQSFCQECLDEMKKYPVQPSTPVVLPRTRAASAPKRVVKRRVVMPEEQIRGLRRWNKILAWALVVMVIAVSVLAYPAWKYIDSKRLRPGQNYTTITSATAPVTQTDTAD